MKTKVILALTFFFATQSFSQTKKTVDSLQNEYQKCLNEGQYMLGCSQNFIDQMDSMLNLVYFKIYHSLDKSNQVKLKREQRLWLVKRDNTFKLNWQKIHKEAVKSGFAGGTDERMIGIDKNASVIKERVLELILRLKK